MINLNRKPEVLESVKFSKSTLHNKINDSEFPPPIQLGERAVAWPDYEIEAMIKAYIAGFTQAQIKALVVSLLEARKSVFDVDFPTFTDDEEEEG